MSAGEQALRMSEERLSADHRASVRSTPVTLHAADGYALSAHCWLPAAEPRAVVVINPATAVVAAYYHRYAGFLAENGFAVLTYDYRGIGASRPADLRAHRAITKLDWGRLDCETALCAARDRFTGLPLHVVAHSIGGLLVGLAESNRHVSRCLSVGAQYAYWRDYAPRSLPWMVLRWHVLMPLLSRLLGYFPGKALGWHEDLPAAAAYEWAFRPASLEASYRRHGLGAASLANFRGMNGDILAISLSDDPFGTPAAIHRLLDYFSRAQRFHLRITPQSAGVRKIGHFAFFHDRFRDSLWRASLAWLSDGHLPPGDLECRPAVPD